MATPPAFIGSAWKSIFDLDCNIGHGVCQLIKRDSRPATVRFDDRWNAVRTVDLLALDDFGAQSDMPWARERPCQLVNYRVHQVHNDLPAMGHVQGTEREFSRLEVEPAKASCTDERAGFCTEQRPRYNRD